MIPSAARRFLRPSGLVPALGLLALGLLAPSAEAQKAAKLDVPITWLDQERPNRLPPLSLVEPLLDDEGVQGARLAIKDNQTTGRFLGQDFRLVERVVPADGDLGATFDAALKAGERLFVTGVDADALMRLAPRAEAAGALLLDAFTQDDDLRTDRCSPAVFHTSLSRAMKADALAQYLVWKTWRRWFLIVGSHPEDALLAAAYRRAATKFGALIVEERTYEDTGGARRTETGHVQVQRQIPVFTQDAPAYDVIVAADEADVFGEYLPYNTWDPRPVTGSVGLVPSAWSRVHEQWGGTQIQRRFERLVGRPMTDRDYNAWTAVRAIGEAATRTGTNEPKKLHDYMVGDAFALGAFKGEALTFRKWNQQIRQPILLVTPRMLVSVSPQEGFLHQRTPLDTLGFDLPESRCSLNP
ncbi:MAG: ABC transporter substrate-binding protein [Geminicoccaceae bacterium]|nr:ABC transporter substrate-binding protein [Geminicoccaceae bacterium]